MIIPSDKIAERLAEVASIAAQGEAVVAAFNQARDVVVLHNEEDIMPTPETLQHEKTESMTDRVIEYGSTNGGMH
jgi:hypothetical protein